MKNKTNKKPAPRLIQQVQLELQLKGYFAIKYPKDVRLQKLKSLVDKTWIQFCTQSEEHKEQIFFANDRGYENKNRLKEPTLVDHKENFHIKIDYEFPDGFVPSEVDKKLLYFAKKYLKSHT